MARRSTKSRAASKQPKPQTAEAVAKRCIVLIALVSSGHKDRRAKLIPWLKEEGLLDQVSPNELRFLKAKSPAMRDRANATWKIEAILPLLWALKRMPKLPPPKEFRSDVDTFMPMPLEPTADFIAKAKLRSVAVLRREQDRVYRLHAVIRSAQMNREPPMRGVDPGVIHERHHALNWLLNDDGQEWDEVTTDT